MKIILKGWTRIWLNGSFKGASKRFSCDGMICHAIINKGYISIHKMPDENDDNSKTIHVLFKVSVVNLMRFFSPIQAAEIFEIYRLLN